MRLPVAPADQRYFFMAEGDLWIPKPGCLQEVDLIVDTGANETVFGHGLAAELGLDLSGIVEPRRTASGFIYVVVTSFSVELGSFGWRQLPCVVPIAEEALPTIHSFNLLGLAGLLEAFDLGLSKEALYLRER